MAEMISTEREYVRSLGYVIDNYFPEMERADLPPGLQGERGTVFGNWEQLHTFHCQHFLSELERCQHRPLAVGRGFLRHVSPLCWAEVTPAQLTGGKSGVALGACGPGLGSVSQQHLQSHQHKGAQNSQARR